MSIRNYYLKKPDGNVYGPASLELLKSWASEGRVGPDDLISQDSVSWLPAPNLPELEMVWLVHLADGTQYGPIHLNALAELVKEGSLTNDDLVTHRLTDRTCTIREALSSATRETQGEVQAQAAVSSAAALEIAAEAKREPSRPLAAAVPPAPPASGVTYEVPSPSEAVPTAPVPSWRDIAAQKDTLAREAAKWKKLYEEERANASRATQEYEARISALRKSELAALTRAQQLERRLKELEENYRLLKETVEKDPSLQSTSNLIRFSESYRDLSRRFDELSQLLAEKSAEIVALRESRAEAERRADEMIRQMQAALERERAEADQARQRALQLEHDYMQLVREYRQLNDRYIQLRQEKITASGPAPKKSH